VTFRGKSVGLSASFWPLAETRVCEPPGWQSQPPTTGMGETRFPPWTPFFHRSPTPTSLSLPAGEAGLRRLSAAVPTTDLHLLEQCSGEVSERPKERDWKSRTCRKVGRGFKSRPLRLRPSRKVLRTFRDLWVSSVATRARAAPAPEPGFARREAHRRQSCPDAKIRESPEDFRGNNSPSRRRFRPPRWQTFRFRVRLPSGASSYSRSVLGANGNLWVMASQGKGVERKVRAICGS
jgi:hypothetical protein